MYTESSIKKLGHQKRNTNKNWIQQKILIVIEEKRQMKKKMLQTKSQPLQERQEKLYSEAKRRVKKLASRDKRETKNQLAAEVEEVAVRKEQRRVYMTTKRVCSRYRESTGRPNKDKHAA